MIRNQSNHSPSAASDDSYLSLSTRWILRTSAVCSFFLILPVTHAQDGPVKGPNNPKDVPKKAGPPPKAKDLGLPFEPRPALPLDMGKELPKIQIDPQIAEKAKLPLNKLIASPEKAGELRGTNYLRADKTLTLTDVLNSVEANYPLLRAIEEERRIAGGRLLTAMGAVDTNLTSSSSNLPIGTFEGYRHNLGLQQAFPTSGVTTFLQYRGGYGDYPSYNGGSKTADGGELRGGVNIPLARDRDIDRRRAAMQQAEVGVRAAEPLIGRARLDFQRAAARAYYAWLSTGQLLRFAEELLKLAQERDAQLTRAVAAGGTAAVERIDNAQNIAARQSILLRAQQAFDNASVELSLFIRSSDGRPVLIGRERVPEFPMPPKPDAEQLTGLLDLAEQTRPELLTIRLQRENLEIDLRLAQNDFKPIVNAFVAGSQDLGFGKPTSGPGRLDRSGLEMGIEVQQRIQQREARGRIETLDAQLRAIRQREQFLRENIRAEVQSLFVAWNASYEVYQQAKQRISLAQDVAEADRKGIDSGVRTVLQVTLRELAVFDAEVLAVLAAFDTLRALADFRIALGYELLDRPAAAPTPAPPVNPNP